MTRLGTGLALLGLLAGSASADDYDGEKDYAMRGTVELGGTMGFSRSTDSGADATLTQVAVKPFVGYFLAPSFALVGTIDVTYVKPDPGDSNTDVSVLAGAGYFLPLGSVYLGPQAQIGYGQIAEESAFVADAQLLLKVQIGTGGLANVGAGYRFNRVFADPGYNLSTLAFNVGFSVWF